jgi:hypothetical protein
LRDYEDRIENNYVKNGSRELRRGAGGSAGRPLWWLWFIAGTYLYNWGEVISTTTL